MKMDQFCHTVNKLNFTYTILLYLRVYIKKCYKNLHIFIPLYKYWKKKYPVFFRGDKERGKAEKLSFL